MANKQSPPRTLSKSGFISSPTDRTRRIHSFGLFLQYRLITTPVFDARGHRLYNRDLHALYYSHPFDTPLVPCGFSGLAFQPPPPPSTYNPRLRADRRATPKVQAALTHVSTSTYCMRTYSTKQRQLRSGCNQATLQPLARWDLLASEHRVKQASISTAAPF